MKRKKKTKRVSTSRQTQPWSGASESSSAHEIIPALFLASDEIPWTKRLLSHVIRRAAVDYVLYSNHALDKLAKIGAEASEWLFVENVDFNDLCTVLDLEPSVVRAKILEMSEEEARALRGLEFDSDVATLGG